MNNLAYDITDKDVLWTQEQYKKLGFDIDLETARRETYLYVRQVELIYRPITKQQAQEINENHSNDNAPTIHEQ